MPSFPSIFQLWLIINEAFICFIMLMPSSSLASGRRECALLFSLKLRSDRLAQSFFKQLYIYLCVGAHVCTCWGQGSILHVFLYCLPLCFWARISWWAWSCHFFFLAALPVTHGSSCLWPFLQAWACRHTGLSGFYVGAENLNPDPRDFTVISPVSFWCLLYWDMVSPCFSGYSGTCYIGQAGLEPTNIWLLSAGIEGVPPWWHSSFFRIEF